MGSFWTDDFNEFKARVESFFGNIEELAKIAPGIYCHQVLSHGFMEYAGTIRLSSKINKRIEMENGPSKPLDDRERIFLHYEKEEYLNWAKQNRLEQSLLEKGWQEYLND